MKNLAVAPVSLLPRPRLNPDDVTAAIAENLICSGGGIVPYLLRFKCGIMQHDS